MNNRIDAIYARQSVDKKDSISIESQIEFCKYELKGGNCKEYTDKGYSGKNTDRPKFQECKCQPQIVHFLESQNVQLLELIIVTFFVFH